MMLLAHPAANNGQDPGNDAAGGLLIQWINSDCGLWNRISKTKKKEIYHTSYRLFRVQSKRQQRTPRLPGGDTRAGNGPVAYFNLAC